jgi:hypothetical protein
MVLCYLTRIILWRGKITTLYVDSGVELRDFDSYGEPGAMVYRADCVELMRLMPAESVDVVFADPPYRLSTGGVTVKSGRIAPVDKGSWDRSRGFREDHQFNLRWLKEARRVLKPDGTLWVTGTHHIIFSLGFALQQLRYRIINSVLQKCEISRAAFHCSCGRRWYFHEIWADGIMLNIKGAHLGAVVFSCCDNSSSGDKRCCRTSCV